MSSSSRSIPTAAMHPASARARLPGPIPNFHEIQKPAPQNAPNPAAAKKIAKGAIHPSLSGNTMNGSTIQMSETAKYPTPKSQPTLTASICFLQLTKAKQPAANAAIVASGHDMGGCPSPPNAPSATSTAEPRQPLADSAPTALAGFICVRASAKRRL